MTSHVRQDARENAGIAQGKNRGNGYGATSTSWHLAGKTCPVNGNLPKGEHDLIEWEDLCELSPSIRTAHHGNPVHAV